MVDSEAQEAEAGQKAVHTRQSTVESGRETPPLTSTPSDGLESLEDGQRSPGRQCCSASRMGVDDLPDLTSRIMSMGLYDEYSRFREGYLNWREGHHLGARGEHTATALVDVPQRERANLDRWYPTYSTWQWNRTSSYWIAVMFTEGSLLFVAGSSFACVPDFLGMKYKAMSAWPPLFGGFQYLFGAYLMCLETMNVGRSHEDWRFQPFALRSILAHLDRLSEIDPEVSRTPFYAAFSYLFGTLVYPLPQFVCLGGTLSPGAHLSLVVIPYCVGGIAFLLAGYFECVENNVFASKPDRLVWWAAMSNFIGGIFFALGGFVLLGDAEFMSNMSFAIGALVYLLGGFLSIMMWKDEQFGLTFMAGMNKFGAGSFAVGSFQEATPAPTFSARGVFFVFLYCVVSVVAVLNFCLALNQFFTFPCWFHATNACNEALPFCMFFMILCLHSAVVKTPNQQPYHALIIGTRFLAFVIGVNSLVAFYDSVRPGGPLPLRPHTSPPDVLIGPSIGELLIG